MIGRPHSPTQMKLSTTTFDGLGLLQAPASFLKAYAGNGRTDTAVRRFRTAMSVLVCCGAFSFGALPLPDKLSNRASAIGPTDAGTSTPRNRLNSGCREGCWSTPCEGRRPTSAKGLLQVPDVRNEGVLHWLVRRYRHIRRTMLLRLHALLPW